jgi:hypothetical protein
VAWFLQYSVMGFVFQSCDATLSAAMGVPKVVYGDQLFEPREPSLEPPAAAFSLPPSLPPSLSALPTCPSLPCGS